VRLGLDRRELAAPSGNAVRRVPDERIAVQRGEARQVGRVDPLAVRDDRLSVPGRDDAVAKPDPVDVLDWDDPDQTVAATPGAVDLRPATGSGSTCTRLSWKVGAPRMSASRSGVVAFAFVPPSSSFGQCDL
jgi:hypothetical protein